MGKRGPKKQQGIAREANGRPSRKAIDVTKRLNGDLDADEREALRVGVEGRHRHYHKQYGISPEQLRDTDVGTFVGRLRLAKLITLQQCEAAIRFSEVYHDMQATLGGPKPAGAVNLNATHGMPIPENVDRSMKARQDWKAALDAIQSRQDRLRGQGALYAALNLCVLRDAECPHLLDWLRIGLDTLAVHFKIGDKYAPKKAA